MREEGKKGGGVRKGRGGEEGKGGRKEGSEGKGVN